MRIRHADAERDAGACAAIYAPYVLDSVISLELVPPTELEYAERIRRYESTHAFLVAVMDDDGGSERIAGFAYGSQHRERAGYRFAADVSVYLDPLFRRRGIGRALYDELFGLLERQGVWAVCAGITLPNEASVGLHEACGLEAVGVYRRIAWKAERWHDVGWWQRQLRPGYDPPAELGAPVRLDR